jgi:transcriptional regulator PpsR
MDNQPSGEPCRAFADAARHLSGLGPEAVASIVGEVCDIALIVDASGLVLDLAYRDRELSSRKPEQWVGRHLIDTVTLESREKISGLLEDAQRHPRTRPRQVNHPAPGMVDLPVSYSILSVDGLAVKLVFGSDLRPMAELQQRIVSAQIEMERDYRKLRDAEARYRLLFHAAEEPLIAVDGATLKITEANERAQAILGRGSAKLVGAAAAGLFDAGQQGHVAESLGTIRSRGAPDSFNALADGGFGPAHVHVVPHRVAGKTELLLRLTPGVLDGERTAPHGSSLRQTRAFFDELPDGHVIVDRDGSVVQANQAFLDRIRMLNSDRVLQKGLDNWLGASGVDLQIILSNLRENRTVSRFATILRDEFGGRHPVEISAAAIDGDGRSFGFSVRDQIASDLGRSETTSRYPVEQFAELVGRVPLKDLVRDTAEIIEKMCIESALRLTGNNRASAAEMLGLSRQSLYIKLRRYGIADFDPADEQQ